ncbi:glycoside hydrolase family 130 protein [Leifsonia aquatica]|uniref:glycoside hydrolase family 130 protein n=1 Tax=Leifsonia aquatica TaxID=144185 RepID=UPI00380B13CE
MDTVDTVPVTVDALRASYQEALEHTNALTDRISTDQFSAQYEDRPAWVIGPFELDDRLTFRPQGQWDDPTGIGWTSDSVFNPTVIEAGDELHLFYRASPRKESTASRIGHAVHRDGVWHDDPANPVVYPTTANEALGCEDPKVYEADGRYVLFYNAIWRTDDGEVACDVMSAVSDDLTTWRKLGLAVPYPVSQGWAKGAVVPRDEHGRAVRIGGEYLMFLSEGCGGRPMVGHSDDLLSWRFEEQPYLDLSSLPGSLYEVACAAVDGDRMVLDFFYADAAGDFAAAQALYALDDPFTQLALHRGGSLAWGGLQKLGGRWSFAQGWDAAPGERELFFYREVVR